MFYNNIYQQSTQSVWNLLAYITVTMTNSTLLPEQIHQTKYLTDNFQYHDTLEIRMLSL